MNKVGALAEEQGHHPDIYLTWGKAEIKTWTHKIDGLTKSDFILAAKIEDLLMAAEYILAEGNPNVILCERGIQTFETATRNTIEKHERCENG